MGLLDVLKLANTSPQRYQMDLAQQEASDVRDAWSQVLESASKDTGRAEDQHVRSLLSQMPTPVEQMTNDQYESARSKALESYVDIDPVTRWRNEIDAMMKSGNPTLQKAAVNQLQAQQQRNIEYNMTPQPKPVTPSNAKKMGVEMGLTGKALNDFIMRYAMKTDGATVKSGYLTPEEKLEGGLDVDQPFVWSSDGIPKPIKVSGFTEGQSNAAGFAERMYNSESEIERLMSGGFDPTKLNQAVASMLPGGVGSVILDEDQQVFARASMDWIRAKLRKESGATISPSEFRGELDTYFPSAGDQQPVIEAKAKARRIANEAMATSSGGKYKSKAVVDAENEVKRLQAEQNSNTGSNTTFDNTGWEPTGG